MQKYPITDVNEAPAFLSTKDLVSIGFYINANAAYLARIHRDSPDFIKLKRKVLYKKESVIDFIERRTRKGDLSENKSLVTQQESADKPVNDGGSHE